MLVLYNVWFNVVLYYYYYYHYYYYYYYHYALDVQASPCGSPSRRRGRPPARVAIDVGGAAEAHHRESQRPAEASKRPKSAFIGDSASLRGSGKCTPAKERAGPGLVSPPLGEVRWSGVCRILVGRAAVPTASGDPNAMFGGKGMNMFVGGMR